MNCQKKGAVRDFLLSKTAEERILIYNQTPVMQDNITINQLTSDFKKKNPIPLIERERKKKRNLLEKLRKNKIQKVILFFYLFKLNNY